LFAITVFSRFLTRPTRILDARSDFNSSRRNRITPNGFATRIIPKKSKVCFGAGVAGCRPIRTLRVGKLHARSRTLRTSLRLSHLDNLLRSAITAAQAGLAIRASQAELYEAEPCLGIHHQLRAKRLIRRRVLRCLTRVTSLPFATDTPTLLIFIQASRTEFLPRDRKCSIPLRLPAYANSTTTIKKRTGILG